MDHGVGWRDRFAAQTTGGVRQRAGTGHLGSSLGGGSVLRGALRAEVEFDFGVLLGGRGRSVAELAGCTGFGCAARLGACSVGSNGLGYVRPAGSLGPSSVDIAVSSSA